MSEKPKFVVNGKEFPLPENYTLGEMCDAETLFGVDFNDPRESARDIAATLYIAIRRVDPTVTVEDIRTIPATQLQEITSQIRAAREKARKADARPPESDEKTPDSDEPSFTTSSPIGEAPSEPTLDASGGPDSENGSVSDHLISAT